MLTIVATPIGNLKDITLRSLEALKACNGIICEDSRRASILLNHFEISKPLIVLNDFNESRIFPNIINELKQDKNLCLISDAGTPLISDPGFKLVRECLREQITVDSLPGPSAILPALTLSGLPPDKFFFVGYLPEKPGKRLEMLKNLVSIQQLLPTTFVILVAPFKLKRTLEDMQQALGDINITLARELTKIHQQVNSKLISQWLEEYNDKTPKGEFVLLFNLSSSLT